MKHAEYPLCTAIFSSFDTAWAGGGGLLSRNGFCGVECVIAWCDGAVSGVGCCGFGGGFVGVGGGAGG